MGAKQVSSSLVLLALISILVVSVSAKIRDSTLKKIKEINSNGPYLGLLTVYPPEEAAFNASRRFRVGTVNDVKVIYVRCGVGMVNAAAATQQLADFFNVRGIVHFGIAGSLDPTISYGDVAVIKRVANTAVYDMLNPNAQTTHSHVTKDDLIIGEYHQPKAENESSNRLGRVAFRGERFFPPKGEPNVDISETWFNSTKKWVDLAFQLVDKVELNETGLPQKPKVVVGVNGSTADISLENLAYRTFLYDEFKVSVHDAESSAVVMTSSSNGYKVIAIRGLSDLSGADKAGTPSYRDITANNTVAVLRDFIQILHENNEA
ncbi:hypothetical protein Patl1_05978 [Pistacia atlantica]|uniref:Uncharacterized protein n=1 Tax=Pistacia atlantica TaxID=434234 RepID=A0ACC1BT92_9ROSI|nr:hypothetical protein Patl1_05978 [Pistacia atlantica]